MTATHDSLLGKRVLVTQALDFMGPALVDAFAAQAATVVADDTIPLDPDYPAMFVQEAGPFDILLLNLAIPAPLTAIEQLNDSEWHDVFRHLVDPLPRYCRAVVPAMKQAGAGKIVVMGSAAALRGIARCTSYSAARGAQVAFVRSLGVELAAANIQVNLIAQHYVENPTYFPPQVHQHPRFAARLEAEVPMKRLAEGSESAQLALFLASDPCRFMTGTTIACAGGWVT